MTSLGLVATAPGVVELQSVPLPKPKPHELVLETEVSWISNGTESSFVRGERHGGDTPWRPGHPSPFPHLPGYQKVGRVLRAAADGSGPREGERVFATISRVEGYAFEHAGHLDVSVVASDQTLPLPEEGDPARFGSLVLAQVGRNAALRAEVSAPGRALVIGDGMVGHWAQRTLADLGVSTALLGRHRDRLCLARDTGETFDSLEAAVAWSRGADAIVQTAGPIELLSTLVPHLAHRARLVSAAFEAEGARFDVQLLRDRELSIATVSGWTRDRLLETRDAIAEGRLAVMDLVTHEVDPAGAVEVYRRLAENDRSYLGVVIRWNS